MFDGFEGHDRYQCDRKLEMMAAHDE